MAPPCPARPWHSKHPSARKTRLPLPTSPAAVCATAMPGASAAVAAVIKIQARNNVVVDVMASSSTRIGHDIDKRRLPALDHRNCSFERRAEVLWIGDRALAMDTEPSCDGGVVDIRIFNGGADVGIRNAASMARGHGLQIHIFLMVGAVVVKDVEHRNAMVRRRPQRTRHEHEIAVAAECERQAPMLLVCEGRA